MIRTQSNAPMLKVILSHGEEGDWFEVVPGERATIRIHSRQVGGRFSIVESRLSPNAGAPLHSHNEEEIFEILQGEVTFVCGDDRFEAAAGSVVVVPAGMPHLWANLSDVPAHMRATFIPGGFEKVLARASGLSPTELSQLALTFGTRVLGPPLTS
jgi:quercetin dioxygenase-like cupin family protein